MCTWSTGTNEECVWKNCKSVSRTPAAKVKDKSNSESNLISSFIECPRFTGVFRACEEPVKVSLRLASLDLD